MPATLLDITDPTLPLPEFLILDASVVLQLAALPGAPPHPRRAEILAFLGRLQHAANGGTTLSILPLLAFEECYFKICQFVITANARGIRWHEYYKANPAVIHQAIPYLNELRRILRAFPIHISEPEDIAVFPLGRAKPLADRMGELIDAFELLPKDATILSEAERWGIFDVATLDRDWTRADGFNVYTPI